MKSKVYNIFNSMRREIDAEECIDITSVTSYTLKEGSRQLGAEFTKNYSVEELISQSSYIRQKLIDILYRIDISDYRFRELMINTISNSKISDKGLQTLIASMQHIDLENHSSEFIYTVLSSSTEIDEPKSLSKLLVKVIDIDNGSVYDGTCGIGKLLIESNKIAGEQNIKLYGQELSERLWMLAQINMKMHGYENFNIELGDTLTDPKFRDGLKVNKFDYVTMDIPFGVRGNQYDDLQEDLYGRFVDGIVPKSNLDYTFIQHAISSLNENGKASIVVPMGVLFREAMEGRIRKHLINEDIIEGIISLPPVFSNISIPVAIMVFNKKKSEDMKHKIFFIKADELGVKERRTTILSEEEIEKIVKTYINKKEEKNFSRLVDINEIEENNYTLSVQKYIKDFKVSTDEGIVNLDIDKFEEEKNTVHFKDLVKFERGMNLPKPIDESVATHRAVTLSDVQDDELILDNLTPVELKDIKRSEKYKVKKGDLLLSCRGSAIKIAVIEDIPNDIIASNNFIKITPKYNVNPYFIKAYLESPIGKYYIESNQTGTGVKILSASDLYEIPVPMLSSEEQNLIAEKFINAKKRYKEGIKKLERELKENTIEIYGYLGISDILK